MLVPEEVKKCVAFAYYRGASGLMPVGTAFFIGTELGEGRVWLDVVTARHIITGIRSRATDGAVYLRVNLAAGGSTLIPTPLSGWELHPDPAVDVAILRCFELVRAWVEKKVRRHMMRARGRRGFGWKRWSTAWIYRALGVFNDYRVHYQVRV
jgi:hypothetical protein